MLAKVRSGAIVGLDGALVEVEVDILPGLPKTIIVGLPDAAVGNDRDVVLLCYLRTIHYRRDLRHSDAGYDSGGANRAGADTDFNRVRTGGN